MDRILQYLQNHYWLAGAAALLAIVVLIYELRARSQDYSAVQPQEAIRLMNQGAQVVDLRSGEAFAAGHIAGARHFNEEQAAKAAESLKRFKDKPIVAYCDTGPRAGTFVRQLHAAGFTKVFTLRGGLTAWRTENLPLQRS